MRAVLTRIGGWLQAIPLEYRGLCALFVVCRLGLRGMGLGYSLRLDWMFLDDPARLEHHLLESVVSFHVYPPGMNILTGLLLKLDAENISDWAQLLYEVSGLVLSGSLLYLLRAVGLPRGWAVGVSVVFGLMPPAIYFEHLYLYTYPTATLVCFGGACLHWALQRGSRAAFGVFFLVAALLGILRSTFHLSWFLALVGLALLLCGRGQRWRVLAVALLPLSLLLSLYVKNYVIFGSFGSTSASGATLALMTVARMPKKLREEWVRSGKLSPFAKISVFAPPRAYLPYFETSQSERWPELSPLEHSTGTPNFNHWFFMEANRRRAADARTVLRERPGEYAGTVLLGLEQIFSPSTKWHPKTGKPGSPHHQHEQVLGRYTGLYNRVVHGWPGAPVGLYWLLPLALAMALHRVWQLRAPRTSEERAELGVLLFCGFQIFYVVVTSSLFAIGESARYRFQIEAPIWILGAQAALRLARSVSSWSARRLARSGASPSRREGEQGASTPAISSISP